MRWWGDEKRQCATPDENNAERGGRLMRRNSRGSLMMTTVTRETVSMMVAAVTRDWRAFAVAPEHLRNRKEVAVAAVSGQNSEQVFRYLSDHLRDDHEVINLALLP